MVAPFHYDQNRLKAWIEDESADSSGEIARHVETCDTCQNTMESLFRDGLSLELTGSLLREELPAHRTNDADLGSLALLDSSDHINSLGRFSRYEVIETLGRGGMGIVMRAFDPLLDRHCAVKVLAPELASSAAARQRFAREAKSAAAVVHPHVVPIQTVDEHNGLPYLVMPVVNGQSLQQRVESEGPLSVLEAVRIASQVAEGLAAAHAQGLVHRDIKPANILLENSVERVQITDFGLARAIDDATMTRSGVIAGTPQYMSPEQAHGDAIDHRSDLFSLGSVMYFMLTGRSPFRAETTMGVLNRIGNDQPRSLRSINADVPGWLETIVMRLLSKPRDERYADAGYVAELLGHWLSHLQNPETTTRPEVPSACGSKDVGRENTAQKVANGGALRGWSRWLALAAAPLFAFFGVIIILETGKGTLRIESKSDTDVPIVIRQGEDVVEHLTVSQEGASTRLKAGKYIVEIDNADSDLIIADGEVVLTRGGQWLARIAESPRPVDGTRDGNHTVTEESDTERYQYMVWEKGNRVRLSHWFAKSLQLDDAQLQCVNQLITDTWQKYIELEHQHALYDETTEGNLVVTIPSPLANDDGERFFNERQQLDNEFWTKLDEIVSGKQRARLHALSTARGDGNGDDAWSQPLNDGARSRPKAYPSIIGWHRDWYPATVEIWTKGTWFHYKVRVNGHQLGPGDAQELPAVLQHYYHGPKGDLQVDRTRSTTKPSDAVPGVPVPPLASNPNQSSLLGKWRLVRWLNANGDDATEVEPEITVMTIDDFYVTASTEGVSPDDRYVYRLRPGNVLHFVETSDDFTGGMETQMRYSFPMPGVLRFENVSSDGEASGWGSEWQRANASSEPKAAEGNLLTNPILRMPDITVGSVDEPGLAGDSSATTPQADRSSDLRLAKKTNMSQVKVQKDAEFEPLLLIEWNVDKGISWLFSEPPIRREKLGSFPYAFNLGPNQKPKITMIDSNSRRIETRWWMECQDADDRFWEAIREKEIRIRVSDENFRSIADGGRVHMVIYLPESDGHYSDKLARMISTQENDHVLRVAERYGQPVISVLMAPAKTGRLPQASRDRQSLPDKD